MVVNSSNPPHFIATAAAGGFLSTSSTATAYESIAVPCPECKKQTTDHHSPTLLSVCAFRPAKFAEVSAKEREFASVLFLCHRRMDDLV